MYPEQVHPVKDGAWGTEHAVAGIVIGCVIALILLRRGFRGVGIPGTNVRVGS